MFNNTIQIPLTKGYFATIDKEDEDLLQYKWCAVVKGKRIYAKRDALINGKRISIYLHRAISEKFLVLKQLKNERIDHIDGNGLNNVRSNLRVCTHSQNMMNRPKNSNNTSGYKGVWKKSNRWRADIWVNSKKINLGSYRTIEEARDAYIEASKKYHGEFRRC